MKKQNLTPDGLAAKLNELYALPYINLAFEFAAIEVNFLQWIEQNFNLAELQILYFRCLKGSRLEYLGRNCAIAMQHRLPVELIFSQLNSKDHFKNSSIHDTMDIYTATDGTVKAKGSLIFKI